MRTPHVFPVLAALLFAVSACSTVRQLRDPSSLTPDGRAQKTRVKGALDYSVAVAVAASPEVVWAVLTDAAAYPSWNSTVVSLTGNIRAGGHLELQSRVAPDRTFKLTVSTFEAPRRLVWEDGGAMFLGVRTFTLLPRDDGGTVMAMSETFSGAMLGMIEGSLPDFTASFEAFAGDLKKQAEAQATVVSKAGAVRAGN
jgi:uncharacterized protein YndB with AHSA1/START domain